MTCVDVPLAMEVQVPAAPIGALPVQVGFRVLRADGGSAVGLPLPSSVGVTPMASSQLMVTMGTPQGGDSYLFSASSAALNSNAPVQVDLSFQPANGGPVTASAMLPVDTRPSVATLEVLEVRSVDAGVRGAEWAFAGAPVVGAGTPRRDDTLVVRASSDGALVSPMLQLSNISGTMQGVTRAVGCASCPRTTCACFEADLWTLPLRAVTDSYQVRLTAQNERGVAYDGGVPGAGFVNGAGVPTFTVTRLRWRATLGGNPAIRATPALDTQGTAYFGTQLTSTLGSLYALKADGKAPNGTWQGGINVGAVTSVAVAPEGLVYFTASDGTQGGYVSARTTAGGAPALGGGGAAQCKGSSTTQRAHLALALVDAGGRLAGVTAFGAAGGANFGFCTWNPDLPDSFQPKEGNDVGPVEPDNSKGVSNLFVTLNLSNQPEVTYAAHFTGGDAGVFVVRRPPSSAAGLFTFEPKVLASQALPDNGVVPASLMDVGSGARAAMSTNLGATGYFKVNPAGVVQTNFAGTATGKAAVDAVGNQWVYGGGEVQVVDAVTNAATAILPAFPQTIGAPVLGATAGGQPDRVYVVSQGGTLGVAPQVGAGTMEMPWTDVLPLATSTVSASPTLDCNRYAVTAGARANTGVLYVVTNQGEVVSLVVDSPRLDTAAKWPKFQRDAFNSGNTSLSLDAGCP
jgi:hypothetical protein